MGGPTRDDTQPEPIPEPRSRLATQPWTARPLVAARSPALRRVDRHGAAAAPAMPAGRRPAPATASAADKEPHGADGPDRWARIAFRQFPVPDRVPDQGRRISRGRTSGG